MAHAWIFWWFSEFIFILVMSSAEYEIQQKVNVGEIVTLTCPVIDSLEVFDQSGIEITWTAGHSEGPVLASCISGEWGDFRLDDDLFGFSANCGEGVVSVRPTNTGRYVYTCRQSLQSLYFEAKLLMKETFLLKVQCTNESLLECSMRRLPPSFHRTSRFMDITCWDVCGKFNNTTTGNGGLTLAEDERNIFPDAVFVDHIIVRRKKENISGFYCSSYNEIKSCEFPAENQPIAIGILPLVHRVYEVGVTVAFECLVEGEGIDTTPQYEWWISQHIQLSRTSTAAQRVLSISNVSLADDGTLVRCTSYVNGTILSAEAVLYVLRAPLPSKTDFTIAHHQNQWLSPIPLYLQTSG